ncbi:MAG: hypothetical protein Tp172MES593141_9 [Prokaryotic dsDNA virus sp.]|jgi:hypothetical protein|nr:MAG: hypothetical protein Tp172MES593141_9 [Prokaryotic dsDNA virus sp.]|tara:strand:- start:7661 stop:8509 length:849 start_codon:yes stop_codon:yes gene_type:complete
MATIPYITGFAIKPAKISGTGVVTFTDGRNEIVPNQRQCEAYGYTYNPTTGVCEAFKYSSNLSVNLNNENNNVQGSQNVTGVGTNNTYIMGENNEVIDVSRNNILVGSRNQITKQVDNTAVFGTLGEVRETNSFVIGGNATSDVLGKRQSVQLLYGGQTTDGNTVNSYLNNTTDSFVVVPDNTIMYFHADCVAVRVGGTSGSGAVGDYKSWVERGVVINKSGTLSIERERDTIKGSGTTTGWQPTGAVSGTNFLLQIKGTNNMTLEWALNVTFTQIKTGVAL